MNEYYYCVVKAKLKEIDEDGVKRVVIDIPFKLYSQVIRDGNKDVTYSGRVKDRDVLAVVAVKSEDKEALQNWIGYIGDTWESVKKSKDYTDSFTIKIADVKRTVDELGTITEYVGLDKDEPFKFSEWCEIK